jgi:hypothetical protein
MFKSMNAAVCNITQESPLKMTVEEMTDLEAAFNSFGPAPKGPMEVFIKWMDLINREDPCNRGDGEHAPQARVAFLTLPLAKWLHSGRPLEAQLMARSASTASFKPRSPSGFNIPKEYSDWFLENGYTMNVLRATDRFPNVYRLERRTAYYQAAACQALRGKQGAARRAASYAARAGSLARAMGRPADVYPAIRSEAIYRAALGDWKGAVSACDRCDYGERLDLTNVLIPYLTNSTDPDQLCRGEAPSDDLSQHASVDGITEQETLGFVSSLDLWRRFLAPARNSR